MSDVPVFWKREDLYRIDGKCVYAGLCSENSEDCNPEECSLWEAFFDGEVQADDSLSE